MAESDRTGGKHPHQNDYLRSTEAFHEVFGPKPRSLYPVYLPSENEERWFPQWRKRWGKGTGLVCQGDGEWGRRYDEEAQGFVNTECAGEKCPYNQSKACRPNGNLFIMLPTVPGIGVFQIDTISFNSMVDVLSEALMLRQQVGRITGIPLRLTYEPREVYPQGKKKTVWTYHLRSDHTMDELRKIAAASPMVEYALPPVDDSKPDPLLVLPEIAAYYPDDEGNPPRKALPPAQVPTVVTEEAGPTSPAEPPPPGLAAEPGPASSSTIDTIDAEFTTVEQAPPTPPKPPNPPSLTPPPPGTRLAEDIEAFMNELNLSPDQRAEFRRKHPDARLLVAVLRTEASARRASANRGSQSGQGKEAGRGGQERLVG